MLLTSDIDAWLAGPVPPDENPVYDDDHDYLAEDDQAVYGEPDLELVRAEQRAFEQAEQERRQWQHETGHTHERYAYPFVDGIRYLVFEDDCAACWRDHERDVEQHARRAQINREHDADASRAGWIAGIVLAVLFVIGTVIGSAPT